jgi:hypothetical protein
MAIAGINQSMRWARQTHNSPFIMAIRTFVIRQADEGRAFAGVVDKAQF